MFKQTAILLTATILFALALKPAIAQAPNGFTSDYTVVSSSEPSDADTPSVDAWQELVVLFGALGAVLSHFFEIFKKLILTPFWGFWLLILALVLLPGALILALIIFWKFWRGYKEHDRSFAHPLKLALYGALLMLCGFVIVAATAMLTSLIAAIFLIMDEILIMLLVAIGLFVFVVGLAILIFIALSELRKILCQWSRQWEDKLEQVWMWIEKRFVYFLPGVRKILVPFRKWITEKKEELQERHVDRCSTWPYGTRWACHLGTYVVEWVLVVVETLVEVVTLVVAFVPFMIIMIVAFFAWTLATVIVKALRLVLLCGFVAPPRGSVARKK